MASKTKYNLLYNFEEYQAFKEEKEKIINKYPPHIVCDCNSFQTKNRGRLSPEDWLVWKEYLKELTDLLLEPNGNYQKWVWATLSDRDVEARERVVKGKYQPKIEY